MKFDLDLTLPWLVILGLCVPTLACGTDPIGDAGTTTKSSGELGDTSKGELGDTSKGELGDTDGDTKESEELEDVRQCFECWELNFDVCGAQLDACKSNLACTQLMDCPFDCGGSQACVDECKSIIPSGVEPLTIVVECMVCNDGPCAADCVNPWVLSYCQ